MTTLKTAVLLTGLTVLLIVIGNAVGGTSGIVIALGLALVMNGISYWFSDRIALGMAGAREVGPAEAPDLHRLVEELATYARLPVPRVYLIDDPSPNAFATGRDPRHAAVAVTTGITRLLSRRELAGVIAHELAHIKNRDTLIATVAAVIAGAVTALANMAQWALLFGGFGRGDDDEGGLNPLAAIVMIIVAPIAAARVRRRRHRRAHCRRPAGAGRRATHPAAGRRADPVAPRPAGAGIAVHRESVQWGGIATWFSTHPPIEERVARLEEMARTPTSLQAWA